MTAADVAALPGMADAKVGQNIPRNERAQLPVAGPLVDTGSSSATPVIAGVGAGVLLLGTATVVVVRCRKGITAA
ncbi:hypothetical protein F7Q99_30780 [Streptomyces kaniharaensis]|uniref:LPXTG cell wall anchor domain-containing protein n=1 Tax=Streptomyces kaniharaensis TaxID=212423 RepID=A0A6N7L3N7_9ACTN|nr:LAETG motif-containing sortase-dependent surface protein [Streptomyces kaniharaensis]MQS16463.1 hypothetical protein [Streptomyces kaniharaensis]